MTILNSLFLRKILGERPSECTILSLKKNNCPAALNFDNL